MSRFPVGLCLIHYLEGRMSLKVEMWNEHLLHVEIMRKFLFEMKLKMKTNRFRRKYLEI